MTVFTLTVNLKQVICSAHYVHILCKVGLMMV